MYIFWWLFIPVIFVVYPKFSITCMLSLESWCIPVRGWGVLFICYNIIACMWLNAIRNYNYSQCLWVLPGKNKNQTFRFGKLWKLTIYFLGFPIFQVHVVIQITQEFLLDLMIRMLWISFQWQSFPLCQAFQKVNQKLRACLAKIKQCCRKKQNSVKI